MIRHAHPRRAGSEGFVLIAVIVAILIMGGWASLAANRLEGASTFVTMIETEAAARAKIQDALSRLTFVLSVGGRAPCGLQPTAPLVASSELSSPPPVESPCLTLDGALIDTGEGSLARAQDDQGLLSVRSPSRLLGQVVASSEGAETDLVQALVDFTDLDEEKGSRGAEAETYLAQHLRMPTNRWLRTPYQVFDVLGWSSLTDSAFSDLLSLGSGEPLNLNSARAPLLQTLFPGGAGEKIYEARRGGKFIADRGDFKTVVGREMTDAESFQTVLLPAESTRLRIWSPGANRAFEAHLTIDALNTRAPWSLDYFLPVPQSLVDDAQEHAAEYSLSAAGVDRDVERRRSRP